jgi:hypothetical protein
MEKARIIAEIKRTASENEGAALGAARFSRETGVSPGTWRGKYWRTWSEAVEEAGFAPNRKKEAQERSVLILCLIKLTKKNRRFPTYADLKMERYADDSFPGHAAFNNIGSRTARIELVRGYATDHAEHGDVLEFLPSPEPEAESSQDVPSAESGDLADGSVYMVKHGKHYKIGRTYDVPRRHREIAVELPERLDPIHSIRTDDPTGIEAYWHNRFAAKRAKGEWFALTREDLRAFKRRKFM